MRGPHSSASPNFARDSFLYRLRRSAERAPRNADFAPTTNGVRLVPSRLGSTVDVAASGRALFRAALSPTDRVARLVTRSTKPKLTTAKARTLGIRQIVGSYTTIYGGIANRIHNVQLVAHLIDHHYIAPGQEFSFNKTTGSRDASKGFLEAPVIINGELQTGLGGGVCQVSTTVFNAAYEAGLKITARTNHALYISHYPLGRDATVNYPDTDLRFVNDTKHWLLLRTFVGSSSLTVNLYGTSPHRKVVSETAPLTVAGPVPVRETTDPKLLVEHDGRRRGRLAGARRRASSARSTTGNGPAPLRRQLVVALPRRVPHRPRRDEEAAASAGEDRRPPRRRARRPRRRPGGDDHGRDDDDRDHDDADDYDSALAIASTIHCGSRVGRSVCASTHACVVQPSAMRASSPTRSSS